MLQHGFDLFYQFMGYYAMALLYESTATRWISIELIRERDADPWLIVNDVLHCK